MFFLLCAFTEGTYSHLGYKNDNKNTCKQTMGFMCEPWHGISNNVVCATSKGSDQPAHTRSLIRAFASRSNIL